MNEEEMKAFFEWCDENLKGFEVQDCDESQHFYLNGVMIGGWAGDTRAYFYDQNDELAKALRMMNAATEA